MEGNPPLVAVMEGMGHVLLQNQERSIRGPVPDLVIDCVDAVEDGLENKDDQSNYAFLLCMFKANANDNHLQEYGDWQHAIDMAMRRRTRSRVMQTTANLPSAPSAVAALPIMLSRPGDALDNVCLVCQESISDTNEEPLKQMPCSHLFHEDCLRPWLLEHTTCPACRVQIPYNAEYILNFPDDTDEDDEDVEFIVVYDSTDSSDDESPRMPHVNAILRFLGIPNGTEGRGPRLQRQTAMRREDPFEWEEETDSLEGTSASGGRPRRWRRPSLGFFQSALDSLSNRQRRSSPSSSAAATAATSSSSSQQPAVSSASDPSSSRPASNWRRHSFAPPAEWLRSHFASLANLRRQGRQRQIASQPEDQHMEESAQPPRQSSLQAAYTSHLDSRRHRNSRFG